MSIRKKLVVGACASFVLGLVACTSDVTPSGFENAPVPGNFGEGKEAAGPLGSAGTPAGNLASCATQTSAAEARPVFLIFMFDRSGSMLKNNKWPSSVVATRAFFESPQSAGMSASLSFFPNQTCDPKSYVKPNVTMHPLPSLAFGAELELQDIRENDGTPTRPALEGAMRYAQEIAGGQGKDGSVAVVLVTDGLPSANACGDNSVDSVARVARAASTIPTYVIGLGNETRNLNAIAEGGRTRSALIVDDKNPAQIQADFAKAINQIKASAVACDYKIPASPAGQTFDRTKVNVQHITTAGSKVVNQDLACTNGKGWTYDNENKPTRILLCGGTCDEVKASAGKVEILYGCATQSGPVK